MMAPIMIVNRRPSASARIPATKAPKNAPPVNTETTAPVSSSLGLNLLMKDCDAMT